VTTDEVIAGVLAGERRAVGRAISLVERLGPDGREVAAALHPETGRAWRVGVTGAPGVGKSTLISALVRLLRARGTRVAVVSVDPTSPFTRGAVLGDRIRLTDHFLDEGVFIRSMASRGHQGGLAEATADAVLVLDAAGYDVVLVETVGSGQNEVEVRTLADTVVLALMPGSGDGVQAIKAGLMEIPDVLAVTKADREGVASLVTDLRNALSLVPAGPWEPPIVRVRALEEGGADDLWAQVEAHRAFLDAGGRLEDRRRDGLARQLRALAAERIARRIEATVADEFLLGLIGDVIDRRIDPSTAVDRVLERAGLAADVPTAPGGGPRPAR
jgi:LAO/AO transport system kinase